MDGERVNDERIDEIAKGLTAFGSVQSGRYLRLLAKEVQDRRAADRAVIEAYYKKNTGGVELTEIFKEIENLLP